MKRALKLLLFLDLLLAQALCFSQIEITLKRSFVEEFANRVTISSDFHVEKTSVIHAPSQDGDIHAAGTGSKIGMIAVAEVMNAKTEKTHAVKELKQSQTSGGTVAIVGAWRIWCEHGGEQTYVQGDAVPAIESSGQPHVFEIHPATEVGGIDVRHTWTPINGFTYKDADQAFKAYERTNSHITFDGSTVTISTEQVGDNYAEFVAKLLEEPHSLPDGKSVFVDVFDTHGELLVHRRRLIFAAGTPPEAVILAKHKEDRIQVVGIPRIDLALVKFRVHEAETHGPRANSVDWNLPYELIVAAVTDDDPPDTE